MPSAMASRRSARGGAKTVQMSVTRGPRRPAPSDRTALVHPNVDVPRRTLMRNNRKWKPAVIGMTTVAMLTTVGCQASAGGGSEGDGDGDASANRETFT